MAEQRVGEFNAQGLANTAWAFATAGQPDAQLFTALARTAERRVGEFNTQELANIRDRMTLDMCNGFGFFMVEVQSCCTASIAESNLRFQNPSFHPQNGRFGSHFLSKNEIKIPLPKFARLAQSRSYPSP